MDEAAVCEEGELSTTTCIAVDSVDHDMPDDALFNNRLVSYLAKPEGKEWITRVSHQYNP